MASQVYGRVYELVLRGQAENDHSYVGKTTRTLHRRVHGPSGHTCREDVARSPWKASILPGRAGYRLLETIYDTDSPQENARALARAEADWIRRLAPRYNIVRPVRRLDDRGTVRPSFPRAPQRRRTVRRRPSGKLLALCVLTALFTFLAARVIIAMELPWPVAPWLASPAVGGVVAWQLLWRVRRAWRKVTR